ncbi:MULTISPECIES: DUF4291 domain-containing protein [unclassified Tenacibaculum]|uniref:DUF4291 domain-containing protein n=1 Tax=unclassified Tenacibaculum TaxID=2635139 RepID=UPI001F1DE954|nr:MULTISPECIES: DUF4291 domain-containing protein [unclassified Tenacibaculum]MCF2873481.1 DUF4291 domain-containing protein [Tenacibaculum sp. Cn5-1]MCF2933637.1 DUF4291 domain-containing protein [Tenacibaculum sp. Cn5-34]MCG7509781.1 DUF4291 domain-containing protein [Tenacibaculum sp. Cn5-46]
MKLKKELYKEQLKMWPHEGHHIMAQYDDEKVIVYQSYRPAIGNFAMKNQYFGGPFKYTRMTWIKPNFLWMMYRNGWGTKEGQEVVLAIHLKREAFERYLSKAIYSSFKENLYESWNKWQEEVKNSSIRLQWDPDHDPYGNKLERRAIQLGIRNEEIIQYATEDIIEIEDISDFVKEQYQHVLNNDLDKLIVPAEKPYLSYDNEVNQRLMLEIQ